MWKRSARVTSCVSKNGKEEGRKRNKGETNLASNVLLLAQDLVVYIEPLFQSPNEFVESLLVGCKPMLTTGHKLKMHPS